MGSKWQFPTFLMACMADRASSVVSEKKYMVNEKAACTVFYLKIGIVLSNAGRLRQGRKNHTVKPI